MNARTIVVTGASGLIGKALTERLRKKGDRVVTLVRRAPGKDEARWDPAGGKVDREALEGAHAVVHLAGENVGEGRWTPERKRLIFDSRALGTKLIAEAIAGLESRPSVFVSASATGIYGDRGDEQVDEGSERGPGFLADVVDAWEKAADPARDVGIRVVHPRIGIVLARDGGALAKMRTPFSLGLGGPTGPGTQWMSWVALEDVLRVMELAIDDGGLDGPVNVVAPGAVRNKDFASELGAALNRPAVLPLPAFAVRAMFGEMGETLLLEGVHVQPKVLLSRGYSFAFSSLPGALRYALGE